MTSYREILRLHSQGISQRSIAASCGCGKGTVQRTIEHAREHGLTWPLPAEMTDERLRKLFSPSVREVVGYKDPDFEKIHRDMAKSGVTMSLLWNEYSGECRQSGEIPYMYSAFCDRYREYSVRSKATMHIERRPGEQLEVDWAGQTMEITDNLTGEIIPAYIFVAAHSYSGYAYVEGFLSQNQESWIAAHVNAYRFFGWVTRILVPDNLKTGVTKTSRYEPVINRSYHEMAEHYGTAVLPARVRKPKDKPMVEVFLEGERIASHARKHGHPGQYATLPEHMPEDHRKYTQWNAERFLSWARSIGDNTVTVVKAILASRKIEQQGYRACMALLKLSDKYSAIRLEAACKRALTYTPSPSFKSIQTILATGQDSLPEEEAPDPSAEFGFTRGPGYYGDRGDK